MFRFLPKSYHWSELCQTPHSIQVPFPSLEIWREREGETERDLSCLATVCLSIPSEDRKEGVTEVAPYLDRPYFRSVEDRERGSGWGTTERGGGNWRGNLTRSSLPR